MHCNLGRFVSRALPCALSALLVGCASSFQTARFQAAAPAREVYASGFADYVSASGLDVARSLARFRAEREMAKLLAAGPIGFHYERPGDPDSLKLIFGGHMAGETVEEFRVGDSLWVVIAGERSDATFAMMEGLQVVRVAASARGTPLGEVYARAYRNAVAKAIDAFLASAPEGVESPPTGRVTIVALDAIQTIGKALRVTLDANVQFRGEAGAHFERVGDFTLAEAMRLKQAQQLERAAAVLSQLARHSPSEPRYYEELGNIYYDMDRLDKASLAFGMAASLAPKNPEFPLALGQAQEMLGQADEAERCYQKALAIDPSYERARTALDALRQRRKGATSP